jgi:hypothetical protein
MKGFLFFGLAGAILYGALMLSYDLLPRDQESASGQSLGDPGVRQLRSWGSDLPALASSSSQRASLPLPKPAVTPASTSRSASSEVKPTTAPSDGTAYQPIEWAKVVCGSGVYAASSFDVRAAWQRRSS